MRAVWGTKFTANFGTKEILQLATEEWLESLSDLSDEQIELAYKLARVTLKFPPTIAEFRELALGLVAAPQAFYLADTRQNVNFRKLLQSSDWNMLTQRDLQIKFYGAYNDFKNKRLRAVDD